MGQKTLQQILAEIQEEQIELHELELEEVCRHPLSRPLVRRDRRFGSWIAEAPNPDGETFEEMFERQSFNSDCIHLN